MELDYEAMYQQNPSFLGKILPSINDLLKYLTPEDELLDAGCCEGYLYEYLKHQKYTGIDIVPENIRKAKDRIKNVGFEIGNILELSEVWDIVFCSRVLMHLPDYEKNVEKLRKNARKWLIVTIPMRGSYTNIEQNQLGVSGIVQFRSFSSEDLAASKPEKIIKHEGYSTVIYSGTAGGGSD